MIWLLLPIAAWFVLDLAHRGRRFVRLYRFYGWGWWR